MNKGLYPQDVDFNYTIRCDAHQFKPYVYCEMCKIRTKLQEVIDDNKRMLSFENAQVAIMLRDNWTIIEALKKAVSELQIEVKLLKGHAHDNPSPSNTSA